MRNSKGKKKRKKPTHLKEISEKEGTNQYGRLKRTPPQKKNRKRDKGNEVKG